MRRHRFVAIERTFQNQKMRAAGELSNLLADSSVGSINKSCAGFVAQLDRQTLTAMRRAQKTRAETRQNLDGVARIISRDLLEFQGELQTKESVIVRFIHGTKQFFDTRAGKNVQRFRARLRLRRVLQAEQKRRQPDRKSTRLNSSHVAL